MLRLSAALIVLASPVAAQDLSNPPVIVMAGQSVVHRAPDVAYLSVAVEARSKSSREAQRQNAEQTTAVRKRLTDAGIPTSGLRTIALSLDQEAEVVNGRRVPREYVARNGLEIRIDDLARVGEIADTVVQAGATSLGGIRFDVRDRASAEQEAIRLAVADARGRAEAAAAGVGRTIDRIIRIEDQREEVQIPRPLIMMRGEGAAATPVEPGVIDIRARVTLTASMK